MARLANHLIDFHKDKNLGSIGKVGLELTAADEADLVRLENDEPPVGDLTLGRVTLNAEAGVSQLGFKNGAGSVGFNVSAGVFGRLGLYADPEDLLRGIELSSELGPAIRFPEAAASHYYAIVAAGFSADAKADGSIALSPGLSASFGVEGGKDGAYAVIRRFPGQTGSRTAVVGVAKSWVLPRHVDRIDDLAPGTWLVTEVGGRVAGSIGATFGHELNWVRETEKFGLQGDIGLKLELSAKIAAGFDLSGRYGVVVSRESSKKTIRMRLFKSSSRGWNFAASAGAVASLRHPLPQDSDEFVKAVFGTHTMQVLEDVRCWTQATSPDQLAKLASDYGFEAIGAVTGIDPKASFDKAMGQLRDLFALWNSLDERVAAKVASWIESKQSLTQLRKLAARIVALDDPEAVAAEVKKILSKPSFMDTMPGEWLTSLASDAVIQLLDTQFIQSTLIPQAKFLTSLLDGSAVQKQLERLIDTINQKLGLDQLMAVVEETDARQVDAWLQHKLSVFLDEQFDFGHVEDLRDGIELLFKKQEQIYAKAVEALNRPYEFSFSASYSSTRKAGALLDVEFDFKGDAGDAKVASLLNAAVTGKLGKLLIDDNPRVRINEGSLTHEVRRQSSVELTLPWKSKKVDKFSKSLANMSVVESDGRLLLYEVKAEDRVLEVAGANDRRDSQVLVGLTLGRKVPGVRVHEGAKISHAYQLKIATRDARWRSLGSFVELVAHQYFADQFGGDRGSVREWMDNMQAAVAAESGSGHFGDVLLSLEVGVDSGLMAKWWNAPADKNSPIYRDMSIRLQRRLRFAMYELYSRNLLPYSSEPQNAEVLLVYCGLAPLTNARVVGGELKLNGKGDVYWSAQDESLRKKVIFCKPSTEKLERVLVETNRRLVAAGMTDVARRFEKRDARKLQQRATKGKLGRGLMNSLLGVEREVVRGAYEAALELAAFRKSAGTDPERAVKHLSEFGANITEAFNSKFRTKYKGGLGDLANSAMRALGSTVLIEAARAIAGEGPNPFDAVEQTNATLELNVLRSDLDGLWPPAGYVEGSLKLDPKQVLLRQRLIG